MKKKGNLMILRAAEVLLSLVIATALFWGTADEEIGLILSSGIAWLPSVLASSYSCSFFWNFSGRDLGCARSI